MSVSSQAGRKKSNVCVAMKAQEIRRCLVRFPGRWERRPHVVMEPVAATGMLEMTSGILLGVLMVVLWFVLISVSWVVRIIFVVEWSSPFTE